MNTVAQVINNSNAKLMTITFVKADGTIRTLYAKTNIKRYLAKNKKRASPKSNETLIRLYDCEKKKYCSVKLDKVLSVRCGNVIFNNEV